MFTKAEVAKLPAEDQELLAQLELNKARQHEQLLKQARGQGDWRSDLLGICSCVLSGCGLIFALYFGDKEEKRCGVYVLLGLVFILSLSQISFARIGRRFDALLQLLDFDHKNQDDSNNSKNRKVG
jgi:hypothetical protein